MSGYLVVGGIEGFGSEDVSEGVLLWVHAESTFLMQCSGLSAWILELRRASGYRVYDSRFGWFGSGEEAVDRGSGFGA